MSVRRNIKNVVYNYSDAARKVREATSNDPWGPSTSLMQNIAELTYNMVAFSEVMAIIWKRLNDHGRNWRHVYKSLVLLDYLVKYGSKRVAQQCKENIFAIQTLKDFQYIEGNKDQGLNVREKAKQLVALLKDDERLKNERAKAEALKQRFTQEHGMPIGWDSAGSAFSSNPISSATARTVDNYESTSFPAYDGGPYIPYQADPTSYKDYARPENAEEEALQVQLALALSKQEADEDEKRRKTDYIKLSLAMSESLRNEDQQQQPQSSQQARPQKSLLQDTGKHASENDITGLFDVWADQKPNQQQQPSSSSTAPMTSSDGPASVDDWPLLNVSTDSAGNIPQSKQSLHNRPVSANPWVSQQYFDPGAAQKSRDNWNAPSTPWAPLESQSANSFEEDPWGLPPPQPPQTSTAPKPQQSPNTSGIDVTKELNDLFDNITLSSSPPTTSTTSHEHKSNQSFDYYNLTGALKPQKPSQSTSATTSARPEDFLGEHKNLVNLDDLTSGFTEDKTNPFMSSTGGTQTAARSAFNYSSNPFVAPSTARQPTLNELSGNKTTTTTTQGSSSTQKQPKQNPFA